MTRAPLDRVAQALRTPQALADATPAQWDLLIRQARRADLLGRLAALVDAGALWARVPAPAAAHLRAAAALAAAQRRDVLHEVERVRVALAAVGVEPVLLKGAAYVAADLPPARGRMFSDIDVLVARASLPAVEASLMQHGWATTHHSAYDQRYYRTWMHELPPLRHIHRLTVLDVHHAILPLTARLKPDSARLLDGARTLPGGLRVLGESDIVLHAMTHLFHNEEFSHALRDLSDLDLMLRDIADDEAAWNRLLARGAELGLLRPLHLGLRYARAVLDTPVPAHALAGAAAGAGWTALDDALWARALRTPHPSAALPHSGAALFALHVRAHWLRMPALLLARHLLIKSVMKGSATRSGP